jgi:hypothetical protein
VIGDDAYEDEMNDVALFESALRAAVPTKPDPSLGPDLVRRLAATARAATLEAETAETRRSARAPIHADRRRSWAALVARVAVAIAVIPLALAGLAFAGVHLPEPARNAFDRVGVTLPNQPSDEHHATPAGQTTQGGDDVSGAATSGPGNERGNSAAAHRHARKQLQRARGKAVGHGRGRAIGRNEGTPPGHSGETDPPAHSNAGSGASDHSNAGGASSGHSSNGAGSDHSSPPQARGKAVGHSK